MAEDPQTDDHGDPCFIVSEAFDGATPTQLRREGAEWKITDSSPARSVVKLIAARESGHVSDLWFQRVGQTGDSTSTLLHLHGEEASRFIDLIGNRAFMSVVHEDRDPADFSPSQSTASTEFLQKLYDQEPERFRQIISADSAATDVVALARRRRQLDEFEALLADDEYFDRRASELNGPESVWQDLFESSPWIFGASLSGQLLLGWDPERLEQVVSGSSVSTPGKRVDGLLRSAGVINAMVFLELKTHRTPLLGNEYRSGCWAPSDELAGGVAQVHGTVQYALSQIGERLPDHDAEGNEIPASFTYLLRPRSYLVIGKLTELVGDSGGHHVPKVRSFELFRRHLDQPEIITFDELYERARWLLELPPA